MFVQPKRFQEQTITNRVPGDAEQSELRSSDTPWTQLRRPPLTAPVESFRCDVLIVGAGITGAFLAERLTRDGHQVVIVERESPGRGSTSASTAMLLWEIDRSLSELAEMYGLDRAARCYLASYKAVQGLQELVVRLGLPCLFRPRRSLYLAGGEDTDGLVDEMTLRGKVGLPSTLLDHKQLLQTFEITRAGAILSSGAAEIDPVMLTHGLLDVALKRGARMYQGNAVEFDSRSAEVSVLLDSGVEIEAHHVVLATGYAMPKIVRPTIQRVASSWAIATSPQPQNLWPDRALIWEDLTNYHYARTTAEGRIVFGGEDDTRLVEADDRNAETQEKARALVRALQALWPKTNADIEYAWSGTFDSTFDGLPLIGAVPHARNVFAAYGYGGNGITFSYLAAELIGVSMAGGSSPLFDDFAIDRTASEAMR